MLYLILFLISLWSFQPVMSNHWLGNLVFKLPYFFKTSAKPYLFDRNNHDFGLDCKEIKPVNPKVNQSWIFIGRTDAEAEATILWPPDSKNWLIGNALMLGKIEGRRRRGLQRKRWHHWLNGHEYEQTLRDSEGQGSLAWHSPSGHKESDMTEWLNNSKHTFLLLSSLNKYKTQACKSSI